MQKINRIIIIVIGILFVVICSDRYIFAAPQNGEKLSLKQPDGNYVDVKIYGDEFYQRVESLDGYTLIRDPKTQYICYAELNNDKSNFVSTGVVYINKHKKTSLNIVKGLRLKQQSILEKVKEAKSELGIKDIQPSQKSNGLILPRTLSTLSGIQNIKGLTIVIEFPQGGTSAIPINEITDFLNKPGYNVSTKNPNNGSVRDYFWDVSGGMVDYENFVFRYTAKHSKSYYDRIGGYPYTSLELVQEAMDTLKGNTEFLSVIQQLTRKFSGEVMALNVLYAGSPEWGWTEGLWPHSWGVDVATINGIRFKGYQITNIGSVLTLRTFAHENGHMLFGFPDLYDYSYVTNGVGNFCLMGYGGSDTNPVPPCLYLRNRAGWSAIVELNQYERGTTIAAQSNLLWGFRYSTTYPNEYYTVEFIKKENRYLSFPGNGFVVAHIDENGSNNTIEANNPLVSIVTANNEGLINHYGSQNNMFPYGRDDINSNTSPSSELWGGEISGFGLTNIMGTGMFTYDPDMALYNGRGIGFKTEERYFDSTYRNRVWPGDINGDGNKDLVSITINGEVDYCLANNNGTFQNKQRINTRIFPSSEGWFLTDYAQRVWPADVNGDRKVDFVGVHYDGRIFTAINNGNYTFGTFSAKGGNAFKSSEKYFDNTSRDRVWPADINGDGKDDLISITIYGNIDYAISYGNGNFSNQSRIISNIFPTDAGWFLTDYEKRVWPADINGDKKVDFVGINYNGQIITSINNGNFTFGVFSAKGGTGFHSGDSWFGSSDNQRVWATDMNNDKCADIVGIAYDGSIYCAYSNGNGVFKNSVVLVAARLFPRVDNWFVNSYTQRVWPTDINGSGKTNFIGVNDDGSIFYTPDLP